MKKNLFNIKTILITSIYFCLIFTTSFLCYIVSYFSKNYVVEFYILISFIVLLFILSYLFLIFGIKSFSKKNYSFLLTASMIFISASIMTIILKIISIKNQDSFLLKTGLVSVMLLLFYFVSILGISLLPIFKQKKEKIFQEDKI